MCPPKKLKALPKQSTKLTIQKERKMFDKKPEIQNKNAMALNLPCSSVLSNEHTNNKRIYSPENPVISVLYKT
jgi:hypothetical protein